MTNSLLIAGSLIERGIIDFQNGQTENAIGLFTAALQHDSGSICAYANRATVYYTQGCYQQALNDLSRALELAPNLFALYINRGLTYNKLGETERSTADFGQAIRLDPQCFSQLLNQTIVLSPKEPEIAAAPASANSQPLTYSLTGVARKELHQGIFKVFSTMSEFCAAVNIPWDDFTLRKTQTDVLKFALLLYNQAIAKEPDNPFLYWDRSCLLSDTQQFEQAILDLNRALRLAPNNAVFWSNRGVVHYKLLDLSSALSDFTKALELNPNDAAIFANRAIVLIGLKRLREAVIDLERAIQITPDNGILVRLYETLSLSMLEQQKRHDCSI
ncbi:MAG: tetratricopeptide repeat protein [Pegethrix bostrychoides GSE-TBD4-15B]|jgi:tetratricopeptide (TPR) repeat protein|uniref:Tetratricopeptide repeat protein n=1 Tax=Pegethrix bostrychoides GSE-TBD4-15B TaxID=2839662 RepID=A0A951U3K3_9CYAN|nr:tetratricopeptide repeat protein [Pegethrix bostrychoides GSE-TBD4-15B]